MDIQACRGIAIMDNDAFIKLVVHSKSVTIVTSAKDWKNLGWSALRTRILSSPFKYEMTLIYKYEKLLIKSYQ
jgi:hypothetical protein